MPHGVFFSQGIPRLNTVVLTGYLGQDPKPRYFDSGKVVLNLSLAVKREYHPIEVSRSVLASPHTQNPGCFHPRGLARGGRSRGI